MKLRISDFYNRATIVRVPLSISATERSGLRLSTRGTLLVDSAALALDAFSLTTPATSLDFSYMMGMGDLASDPTLPVSVKASGRIGTAGLCGHCL